MEFFLPFFTPFIVQTICGEVRPRGVLELIFFWPDQFKCFIPPFRILWNSRKLKQGTNNHKWCSLTNFNVDPVPTHAPGSPDFDRENCLTILFSFWEGKKPKFDRQMQFLVLLLQWLQNMDQLPWWPIYPELSRHNRIRRCHTHEELTSVNKGIQICTCFWLFFLNGGSGEVICPKMRKNLAFLIYKNCAWTQQVCERIRSGCHEHFSREFSEPECCGHFFSNCKNTHWLQQMFGPKVQDKCFYLYS